jgi:hypothetical protein
VLLAGLEQHAVQVAAVHDGVGVAEARPKGVAEIDMRDLLRRERVHEPELLDVDRGALRRRADAEAVETREGVRPELDAGADLAEPRGLLEHQDRKALARQPERGRQPADAAPGDEDRSRHPGAVPRSRRVLSRDVERYGFRL